MRVILILTCVDGSRIPGTILTGLATRDAPRLSILVQAATILTVRMVCSSCFPRGEWFAVIDLIVERQTVFPGYFVLF